MLLKGLRMISYVLKFFDCVDDLEDVRFMIYTPALLQIETLADVIREFKFEDKNLSVLSDDELEDKIKSAVYSSSSVEIVEGLSVKAYPYIANRVL